jgi:hypothetical protein
VQLNEQIHKIMQKDIQERQKGLAKEAVQVSDAQNSELLEGDRDTMSLVSKDIDVEKIVNHNDDAKKHISMAKGN